MHTWAALVAAARQHRALREGSRRMLEELAAHESLERKQRRLAEGPVGLSPGDSEYVDLR